ncbi:uncharacterized protein LOC112539478 [Tetranychus urticae]|uniref:uncharacterized protein LOC112539478 n=1 Tax=Tetranychus urticae TaxID=32264 RepID=UPI000D64CBC8|nr:uncharacterized protein LOC112539478 [Tetranychus urticae]
MAYVLFFRSCGLPEARSTRFRIIPIKDIRPVPPAKIINPLDRILIKDENEPYICFAVEFGSKSSLQQKKKSVKSLENMLEDMQSKAAKIKENFESQEKVKFKISDNSILASPTEGSRGASIYEDLDSQPAKKLRRNLEKIIQHHGCISYLEMRFVNLVSISCPLHHKILEKDGILRVDWNLSNEGTITKIMAVLDDIIYKIFYNLMEPRRGSKIWMLPDKCSRALLSSMFLDQTRLPCP